MMALDPTLMQPKDAEAAAALVGGMAGCFFLYIILVLGILGFLVYCFWRIFTKAGMNGALSLLMLVPGVGVLIVVCLLAFGDWPSLKNRS